RNATTNGPNRHAGHDAVPASAGGASSASQRSNGTSTEAQALATIESLRPSTATAIRREHVERGLRAIRSAGFLPTGHHRGFLQPEHTDCRAGYGRRLA